MDVEHSAHRPEWNIVKTPSKKEPCRCHKSCLSFLSKHDIFCDSPLSLETWVGVHDEKDQEEYYVTPPNDWISKQINSGLSLMASKDNHSLYKVLTQWFVENISKLFYFQPNHSKLMFMIYTMENIHSISQIIRDATNCIGT